MPDLFKYLNYRHYLRDYYRAQKEKKGDRFSYRSFARAAGLSSPNFLKLVIEGKRNLGTSGILAFSRALRLKKSEQSFFENLVRFNQADTDQERNQWYQRLSTSRQYHRVKEIEQACFEYYSHWYHAAIRELVLLPNFQADPQWIAAQLSPTILPKEAKRSLLLLEKLGFIQKDKKGNWVQVERNISTAREVVSLAIANYHRHMIQLALDSIEGTPGDWRDISSLTVAISKKQFSEAKRRIQEFRRELNVLLSEENSEGKDLEAVYQINFQIFNLTQLP